MAARTASQRQMYGQGSENEFAKVADTEEMED